MSRSTILDDLYRHDEWANARLFKLCEGLTDAQLDQPREMGFGSLRNTIFHVLAAEEVWYERWTGTPWRPFPMSADGLSLADMARRFEQVADARRQLMDRERGDGWQRVCRYEDSKRTPYEVRLDHLLLHVANHGIYHRAQAVNYLKHLGRTVPGGLDYIFFRIAFPHVKQEAATVEGLRKYGLEVESGTGDAVAWNGALVANFFAAGDWANQRILARMEQLPDDKLDRAWEMGMGTIRKTALHIADAERWWLKNWTIGPSAYEKSPETTSIDALRQMWDATIAGRNQFLASLDAESAQRVVPTLIGPMSMRTPVVESMVQLCGHGTHHRAQLVNMLRHSEAPVSGGDYLQWIRETS